MTKVMKDVKRVEDDLVKQEDKLERKVKEDEHKKEDDDGWGSDQIHMHPLMPHIGRHKNLQQKLHDLGERIHKKIINLRKEIFDKDLGPKDGHKDEGPEFPQIHIIKMSHPPPFFPSFLNFDEDN